MTAEGVIRFLVTEGVLLALLMLALYGIRKFVSDGEVAKWVSLIVILLIGGAMLVFLLRFAGVF